MTFRLVFACFIGFLTACGSGTGGSPSTDGSAGSPNTGGSDLGGNDGSAAGSQGGAGSGGGNSDVCHPPTASIECQSAKLCECLPTYSYTPMGCESLGREYPCDKGTNTPEWCALVGEGACPEGSNTCSPNGDNACGYDLPPGEVYSEPKCKEKINGDMWTDGTYDGHMNSGFNENGQLMAGSELYGFAAPYFDSFLASGERLYWNRANATVAESAEGVFADDCETITLYFYWPGETEPDPLTDEYYWLNEGW